MNGDFDKIRIQYLISVILIIFLTVTGATYAYFAVAGVNEGTITGNMATVNLTLDVKKIFPSASSTNTGVMVPQLSVSGSNDSPLSSALKNGCVDGNGNVICQVYEIKIANIGGSATQVVDGSISFYGNAAMTTDVSVNMPSLKWKRITSINTTTPSNSVLGSNVDLAANFNKNIFADDIILATNDNYTYYIIIWINETNNDQVVDEGKSFFC